MTSTSVISNRKRNLVVFSILIGALLLGLFLRVVPIGSVTTEKYSQEQASALRDKNKPVLTEEKKNIPFSYPRYRVPRHLLWSGIFPLEGGFIPDPHFFVGPIQIFTDPELLQTFHGKKMRVQLVSVNPFFKGYRDWYVLVEIDGVSIKYQLDMDHAEQVLGAGSFSQQADMYVLPYMNGIAFYVERSSYNPSAHLEKAYIFVVQGDVRKNQLAKRISESSHEARDWMSWVKSNKAALDFVKTQACFPDNPVGYFEPNLDKFFELNCKKSGK